MPAYFSNMMLIRISMKIYFVKTAVWPYLSRKKAAISVFWWMQHAVFLKGKKICFRCWRVFPPLLDLKTTYSISNLKFYLVFFFFLYVIFMESKRLKDTSVVNIRGNDRRDGPPIMMSSRHLLLPWAQVDGSLKWCWRFKDHNQILRYLAVF